MGPSRFSLIKWYMDCVTDGGDAVILYCSDLRWHGIHSAYCSVLSLQGELTESHSCLGRYRLAEADGRVDVEVAKLRIAGRWEADAAAVKQTVFKSDAGAVVWNCMQPRSLVHVQIGGREVTGLGYAECLTVSLPPWQLPMQMLRWGRFVSRADSLTWLDWQGPYATSFAIHNGRRCDLVAVSDSEVAMHEVRLTLDESLPLRAGRLGATILPGVPTLAKLLPRSLFNIEEHKWRSLGVLKTEGGGSTGWAIHEVVHWNV